MNTNTDARIIHLARKLERLRKLSKRVSSSEDEVKEELNSLLDQKVSVPTKITTHPGYYSKDDVKILASEKNPDYTLEGVYPIFNEQENGLEMRVGWKAVLVPIPSRFSITTSLEDGTQVSRKTFTVQDGFDFDRLKEVNPELFEEVVESKTSVEYSIDEEALDRAMERNPEILVDLQEAAIPGKLRARLNVKVEK